MSEQESRMFVDDRLMSYKSFFDHAWAKRLFDLTNGSALEIPSLDLCATWRGVANAAAMPWILANSVSAGIQGAATNEPPLGLKWVGVVHDKLMSEIGELEADVVNRIKVALDRLFSHALNAFQTAKSHEVCTPDSVWSEMFCVFEWPIALWGSQRMCYCTIVFAYEDFVQKAIAIAFSDAAYTTNKRNMGDDIEAAFDADMRAAIWDHDQVKIARLARNAIAHNGGRLSQELKLLPHNFRVESSAIQIVPEDVRTLIQLLGENVETICRILVRPHS